MAYPTNPIQFQSYKGYIFYNGAWVDHDSIPVFVKYSSNSGQAITSGEIINFEDLISDNLGCVTVGAAWKFTAPISGIYHICARTMFTSSVAWGVGDSNHLYGWVNDVAFGYLSADYSDAAKTGYRPTGGSIIVELNKGDYFHCTISHGAAAGSTLYTSQAYNHIEIAKIGRM